MRIVFPTDDGLSINPSFGQAQYYLFVTVDENGAETGREQLPKPNHSGGHHHHGEHHGPPKGVFAPLKECQTVISGGIGEAGFRAITNMELNFILTSERSINVALAAYLNNTLQHVPSLVHKH
ncbi:NifB/NifX family molybdenum-iron cluster-binding protein [Anaerolineales bacterium HSG24]|nr:NifB/NifX family molybdenum-iron cluster-binding protein [Anaerolineales bacterium HSG24]